MTGRCSLYGKGKDEAERSGHVGSSQDSSAMLAQIREKFLRIQDTASTAGLYSVGPDAAVFRLIVDKAEEGLDLMKTD